MTATKQKPKTSKKVKSKKAKAKPKVKRIPGEVRVLLDKSTATPIGKNICQAVRTIRKESGMSRERFASELSLSVSNLTAIEQFKYPPTHQVVYRISKKFKRSLDSIYGEDQSEPI